MFNCGTKHLVRAIVCLYSIRKHYNGNITFFIEESTTPKEFDGVCKYFNVDIVKLSDDPSTETLIKKTKLFKNPPYDRTLWIDTDTIVIDKIDEMFDCLDMCDVAIPNFSNWISSGKHISKRINRFKGLVEDKYIDEALKSHPAINTGVLSFRKSDRWNKFVEDWVEMAKRGGKIFIRDETMFQILYPKIDEWGLKCFVADPKFNVSVMYGNDIQNKRIIHYHGNKNVLENVPLCDIWKSTFEEMRKDNVANINEFLKYADKRLRSYLEGKQVWGKSQNVTIVTAVDPTYLPILKETFPNWKRYKNIDAYPVLVFVNGLDLNGKELDFLRLPNVTMMPWDEFCMDKVDSHRELMLSAFILGAAEHVKTDYWLKLDADSYATDNRPFITEEMKKYNFFGHRWGYSKVDHIRRLDEWSKNCWHPKIKNAPPMINEGRIDENRFFHNRRRTISFIQLHKTRFTRYCVKVFGRKRLPAPTQDTTMFYIADRIEPESIGIGNFKKDYGFTQGNGRLGAENIRQKILEVDRMNDKIVIKVSEEWEITI